MKGITQCELELIQGMLNYRPFTKGWKDASSIYKESKNFKSQRANVNKELDKLVKHKLADKKIIEYYDNRKRPWEKVLYKLKTGKHSKKIFVILYENKKLDWLNPSNYAVDNLQHELIYFNLILNRFKDKVPLARKRGTPEEVIKEYKSNLVEIAKPITSFQIEDAALGQELDDLGRLFNLTRKSGETDKSFRARINSKEYIALEDPTLFYYYAKDSDKFERTISSLFALLEKQHITNTMSKELLCLSLNIAYNFDKVFNGQEEWQPLDSIILSFIGIPPTKRRDYISEYIQIKNKKIKERGAKQNEHK